MNILFVAGGRRVSLIERFRKHLSTEDRIIVTDTIEGNSSGFVSDKVYIVGRYDSHGFCKEIADIISKEDIGIVVPLFDLVIPEVAKLSIEFPGTKFVCPNFYESGLFLCKERSIGFFETVGVLTPSKTDLFPCFIRRRNGFGSIGAELINTRNDLLIYSKKFGTDYIRTENIVGKEYSVDCYLSKRHELVSTTIRSRDEVRNGEVQKSSIVFDDDILNDVEKICKHIDYNGPMTLQCIKNDDGIFWIEVNTRFGGGSILTIESGCDMPKWIIDEYNNIEPTKTISKKLSMVRSDREFFHEEY